MDAILQLFEAAEILNKLGQKKLTGCFHAFTPRESANVLFKDGVVVGAVKAHAAGQVEGESVIAEILGWKEARYLWQPNSEGSTAARQPMQLDIREFLGRQFPGIPAPEKTLGAQARSTGRVAAPTPTVISIPSRGKSTGLLPEVTARSSSTDHTATKTLNASAEERSAHDEALLEKHQLVLEAATSGERHRIARVSSLIGRSPACEITIADPSISRQHCLLQITERGLLVKDMGTTNGTKVNGITLKEGYINIGDKLTVGHLVFELQKV